MSTASGASRVADGHHLTQPKYRPDIDGLRGLAVLAVMGYHAFPRLVRGGFVGVDVFFVISGFLISSILFKNLENNSFSYTEFYSRRMKSFPALIVILIPCLFLGWFLLPTNTASLASASQRARGSFRILHSGKRRGISQLRRRANHSCICGHLGSKSSLFFGRCFSESALVAG